VGTGLAIRPVAESIEGGADLVALTTDLVHTVTRKATATTRLTGKARLAHWLADCLARSSVASAGWAEARPLARGPMVLCRSARARGHVKAAWPRDDAKVPAALVELCFRDPATSDEDVVALAARIASGERLDRELPEDELDLDPAARSWAVLERAVMAAI